MNIAAVIVAAGRGTRAGGGTPKQFRDLAGKPVLRHTVDAMLALPEITSVTIVLSPADKVIYQQSIAGLTDLRLRQPVNGGEDRRNSVRNGLESLVDSPPDFVLIHDAARPLTPTAVTRAVISALDSSPAAFPVLPVVDALWQTENGLATSPQSRETLVRAQTPQGFHFPEILAAHRAHSGPADDDVTIARHAGLAVACVPGDTVNFKITTQEDFTRAERQLEPPMIRCGNGFDVHAFTLGDHVTLCGIDIPHDQALKGHSDADVAMHAITDAIYGALARGDIGQHFPPSDPQWKEAPSDIFLRHANELASDLNMAVTHIDCTIICEHPKIGPHAQAMRENVARILDLSPDAVSIKATTSEGLGFTGRGEGIAAMATATLSRP